MPRLDFTLGSLKIRECSDGLILCGGDGWRDRHPEAINVHLTLLWRGERTSHVTIVRPNGKSKRDDLAEEWFAPPKLPRLFSRMHQLLGAQWQRHLRPVDLEELSEDGFVAVPITAAAAVRHLSGFLNPSRPRIAIRDLERFNEAVIDLMCECAVLPSDLPLLLSPTEPICCFQLSDDGSEGKTIWLTSADGDHPGERRWFAVDANAFAPSHLRPLFDRHLDPGVTAELRRVASHFSGE